MTETATVDKEAEGKTPAQKNLEEVHRRAIQRFYRADQADLSSAADARKDLEFLAGDQWDATIRNRRKVNDQPCLTLNMMEEKINQVVGDQRQARPQIKVLPFDSVADPDTADKINGLVRAIMNGSDSEMITDNAFESSSACGRGAWRVITEYEDEWSFNQVVVLKWIQNVFAVKWDPGAQDYDKQDGKYFFLYQNMPKEDYQALFPGREVKSMPSDSSEGYESAWLAGWDSQDTVRVAEYFERIQVEREIVMLESGKVVEADKIPRGAKIKLRPDGKDYSRKAPLDKIIWYKLNGAEILEGPKEFPCRYFPIVMVWGKETNIDGKRYIRGMVRTGKDAQRMINYAASRHVEVVALQPIAPFIGTPKQIAGHEAGYSSAAKGEAVDVLLYNTDELAATPKPERVIPPQMSSGWETLAESNKVNLQSTMGIYPSSIGGPSNETSGTAIQRRQQQGERGTFAYQDNLSRSLRTLGRILLDMIPRIYDAERIVRILGLDGSASMVKFGDRPEGYDHDSLKPEDQMFDPKMGKYDVVITVGPSHQTRRQEAVDAMTAMVQAAPLIAPIVLPRLAKMMDFPDADELAQDLEVLLPPDLRAKRMADRGETPEAAPGPQILGPDGQPVSSTAMQGQGTPASADQGQAAPVESQPDPSLKHRETAEQARAMIAVLEMRAKAKAMGLSDKQIDALAQQMEQG